MPRVPTYSNFDVQPTNIPSFREHAPAGLVQGETQGARQESEAGHALTRLSTVGQDIVTSQIATTNEASVKAAHTRFLEGVTSVLNDPSSGYLQTQGENALAGATQATQSIKSLQTDISGTLANPVQRQMFTQVSTPTVLASQSAIDRHAGTQNMHYAREASQARAHAASDFAVRAFDPNNPATEALFAQGITTQQIELEHQAALLGLKGTLRRQYILHGPDGRSGLNATYGGVVTNLISKGDTQGAQAFLKANQKNVAQPTYQKLQEYLTTADNRNNALGLSISLKAKGGIEAQTAAIDAMFKDGKINQETHALTLQKLRGDWGQQQSALLAKDKQVLGDIWGLKTQHGLNSVADLSPDILAYIKSRGLGPRVDAIMAHTPAADDPQVYMGLVHEAFTSPEKFLGTDITQYYGQLSTAHQKAIDTIYKGLLKQNTQEMQPQRIVYSTVRALRSQLLAAGLDPSPAPGSNRATQLASFEAGLHDELSLYMARNPNATPADAMRIGTGILKQATLAAPEHTFFGVGFGHETLPAWQMTQAQRDGQWTVPAKDAAQITAALQGANKPVTPQAIQAVYKQAHGVFDATQ